MSSSSGSTGMGSFSISNVFSQARSRSSFGSRSGRGCNGGFNAASAVGAGGFGLFFFLRRGRRFAQVREDVFVRLGDALDKEGVFRILCRYPVNQDFNGVDGVEKKVQGGLDDGNGARPELAEHIFGLVRDIAYALEPHHGGRALERMRCAKQLIDRGPVDRVLLKGQESRIQVLNVLSRFHEKKIYDL